MTKEDNRRPIMVVTGFLGSGKTTLLSNVLKDKRFANTEVIINEYGQAGLDHRLIRRIEEKTRLLGGGCICCNMRDDLIDELKNILNEWERGEIELDRVVIETTGLADPAPVLFSVLMDPLLTNRYYVEGVICCLDAVNGELHLRDNPESVKQVVSADTLIITKTDIADGNRVEDMRRRLYRLNPAAVVMEAANGKIDPEALFAGSRGRMDARKAKEGWIKENYSAGSGIHNRGVRSISVKFYQPLDWTAFGLWMSMLLYAHGEKVMRVKGIVDVGDAGPVVINGVQHIIHPSAHLPDWNGEEKNSQIVFIMKELEPDQIMDSLMAFQNILGSAPEVSEVNFNSY